MDAVDYMINMPWTAAYEIAEARDGTYSGKDSMTKCQRIVLDYFYTNEMAHATEQAVRKMMFPWLGQG